MKKKDLIIYPAFPAGNIFQGNQIAPANEGKKPSFITECQLMSEEKNDKIIKVLFH